MAATQEDRTTPAAQPAVQPAAEVAPVSFSEDLTAAQVRLYVKAKFPSPIWKILDDHEHLADNFSLGTVALRLLALRRRRRRRRGGGGGHGFTS